MGAEAETKGLYTHADFEAVAATVNSRSIEPSIQPIVPKIH